jgi:shikimate 5-dehydrogenase
MRNLRATVLGAGGAGRSVSLALASIGAKVTIAARRLDRAQFVATRTGATAVEWPPAPNTWDVLVNATPLGTAPDITDSPLPGGPFGGHLVYDLVYNPSETRLLREARAAGCRTIGGLAMLVGQAQRQFEWWTGERIDPQVMRDAAMDALTAKSADAKTPPGAVEI